MDSHNNLLSFYDWAITTHSYVSTTMVHCKRNGTKDELAMPNGPVTRSRVKKFKEALQSYMGRIVDGMESQETMTTNGIISNQMGLNLQEDSNSCLINYFKLEE